MLCVAGLGVLRNVGCVVFRKGKLRFGCVEHFPCVFQNMEAYIVCALERQTAGISYNYGSRVNILYCIYIERKLCGEGVKLF